MTQTFKDLLLRGHKYEDFKKHEGQFHDQEKSVREQAQLTEAAQGTVSTSAQSLSQGATEQAASLEETSASMEDMASMTRKNAESSASARRGRC